ncbi:MAG: molecular chaperone TorD family protein [Burkholderiaceae bacterium]
MSDQDKTLALLARADLCRFLAACYYEPSPEFAEEKLFDSMGVAARRMDPELAAAVGRLGAAFAAEDPQELLIDYTRLFLGPVKALVSPYASVWLEREKTLMQESTMAVVALYEEGGFEIDENFRDLPDHIAAELEFLYLLNFRALSAELEGDAAAGAAVADLRQRFLADHLARWVAPFTAAAAAHAQSAFYRELAGITALWVAREAAQEAAHA